ncbi:hypothetical protein O181_010776 [Austropuccinia psidii MF-1]|uniref:Activating signal cointegrator 1 complex subunit 3 n=1 Tax=Austropuccinia psidii MF-1 TaxID=1389203 RepID=A0A9Q3BRP1_9BASI|nr:hypothetical protein [Austropuccinia psidii MF-1]
MLLEDFCELSRIPIKRSNMITPSSKKFQDQDNLSFQLTIDQQDQLISLENQLNQITLEFNLLSHNHPYHQSLNPSQHDIDLDPQVDPDDLIISEDQPIQSIQVLNQDLIRQLILTHHSNPSELDLNFIVQSIFDLFQDFLSKTSSQSKEALNPVKEDLSYKLLDLLGLHSIELIEIFFKQFQYLHDYQDNEFNFNEGPDDLNKFPFDLNQLETLKAQKLIQAQNRPLFSKEGFVTEEAQNPHIFSSAASHSFQHPIANATGTKYALPVDTKRTSHEHFEEILIPPAEKVPIRSNERFINIGELDVICRPSFPGYKTLNRLQSAVYPIAYKTNENMLVCAPTGAGKTDVAMLTILRAISQYGGLNSDNLAKGLRNDFKVIYVAPMKALAAEIVTKMSKRLRWLGMVVKELTGDMQLTRKEINSTHFIVTTPEKWDVVTRKASGEESLASQVRLLIIDEIHLLHEDRGAVIETIVARTLRQVESSQTLIRIVGLSATLPNYVDVSNFLRVNPMQGLFYFDSSFRPVPLEQHFIGVKGKPNSSISRNNLDMATFEKVSELVKEGHQVMVFVHARKETVKTAEMLREKATEEGILELFDPNENPKYDSFKRALASSRNREMKELVDNGFGIHHAGMLRSDRNVSEKLFESGVTRVLCCTATLAWGVNLPAYAVIIKGTQVYDASKGSFVDLGILDVLQIFGRAGRPQYEDHGIGFICTTHDRLDHYVAAITQQHPVESQFTTGIIDSLNAEVALGTVRTVDEGVQWIGWTYLFVRMRKNPLVYGLTLSDVEEDPLLGSKRHSLIKNAAQKLHQIGMIVFDELTGGLEPTELGKIASKYYIKHASIEIFNQRFRSKMSEADVFAVLSESVEFDQIKVRDSELDELENLQEQAPCQVKGGPTSTAGKVNILLQAHISRAFVEDFALVSDTAYVAQNSARISRALIEIGLWKRLADTSKVLIEVGKCIEKRTWPFVHPLVQSGLSVQLVSDLDQRAGDVEVEDLAKMSPSEIAALCRLNDRLGKVILQAAREFPRLSFEYTLQPLSEELLRVRVYVRREFDWSVKVHRHGEPFWIWIADGDEREIFRIKQIYLRQAIPNFELDFVIPFRKGFRTLPHSLGIRAISDRWVCAEYLKTIALDDLELCPIPPEPTTLLELTLLSGAKLASSNEHLQKIQLPSQLGRIETQCFHTVYHTPHDTLICASEQTALHSLLLIAIARAIRLGLDQSKYVVVIAPRKPVVRQIADYLNHALKVLHTQINALVHPSQVAQYVTGPAKPLEILVMTPAVGLSFSSFLANATILTVLMNLHDLNEEYERFVNLINKSWRTTRLIGFSSSLRDPTSVTNWLRIEATQVVNFACESHSKPVSTEFQLFNLQYSSTQWRTMIRPAWKIIQESPNSLTLIFVPSRSQTKGVAQHIVQYLTSGLDLVSMRRSQQGLLEMYAKRFSSQEVADLLSYGVIALEDRMSIKDIRLALDLFHQRLVKIMVLPRDSCWRISTEHLKAETVIVLGTQYGLACPSEEDQTLPRLIGDIELPELIQMKSFASKINLNSSDSGNEEPNRRFVVMCDAEQIERYETFMKNGLALESQIDIDSIDYLDEALKQLVGSENEGKRMRSEMIKCLYGTFLLERVQSNALYYDIDIRHGRGGESSSAKEAEKKAWAVSGLIDRWVESLKDRCCLRAIGMQELEVTEIGKALVRERISVKQIDQLKRRLNDDTNDKNEVKTPEMNWDNLIPSERLLESSKAFYLKLPRYIKDQIKGVDEIEESNERKNDWVVNLLIKSFQFNWVPLRDLALAKVQAHLVIHFSSTV